MTHSKEPELIQRVDRLKLHNHGWIIVDHWEADRCAVGIARNDHPRRLVYLSTYGKAQGKYDYECEEPTGPNPPDYITTASGVDVDFDELFAAIERHLK
jgi:hypothetical protein